MIPLSGAILGGVLGAVAELVTKSAKNDPMSTEKKVIVGALFGAAAGLGVIYAINVAHAENKGQLTT